LLERVRRFQFDKFDKSAEEWTYYIQRFETELAVSGLLADDVMTRRRNLLLSRVGAEAFHVVVDHFRPDPVHQNIRRVKAGAWVILSKERLYYGGACCVLSTTPEGGGDGGTVRHCVTFSSRELRLWCVIVGETA
jgi:hypothetical protein